MSRPLGDSRGKLYALLMCLVIDVQTIDAAVVLAIVLSRNPVSDDLHVSLLPVFVLLPLLLLPLLHWVCYPAATTNSLYPLALNFFGPNLSDK